MNRPVDADRIHGRDARVDAEVVQVNLSIDDFHCVLVRLRLRALLLRSPKPQQSRLPLAEEHRIALP